MNWQYAQQASRMVRSESQEERRTESSKIEANYRKTRRCTFETLSSRELLAADLASDVSDVPNDSDDAVEIRTFKTNSSENNSNAKGNGKGSGKGNGNEVAEAASAKRGNSNQAQVGPVQYGKVRSVEARENNPGKSKSLAKQSAGQGSSLSGWVFIDANQNGLFESEDEALFESVVALSGLTRAGEIVESKIKVDSEGYYEFPELEPGTYKLEVNFSTKASAGNNYVGTLGGQLVAEGIDAIEIPSAGEHSGEEYNFTQSSLTWISGRVFLDADGSGDMGEKEEGLSGVELRLRGETDSGQQVARVTRTDGFGHYWFFNLPSGVYSIEQVQPEGLADGAEILGTAGGIAELNGFSRISARVGQPGEGYLFGELSTSSIEGRIYLDVDHDDARGSVDGAVAGLQVILSGVDDRGEAVWHETSTDFDGLYRFTDLRPGSYSIQSEVISGFGVGASTVGSFQSGAPVNYGFADVQIPAGGAGQNYDMGHTDPNQLGDEGDRHLILNGGDDADLFALDFSGEVGQLDFNGDVLELSPDDRWTVRVLGSFGEDVALVAGSVGDDDLNVRDFSSSLRGSWFNVLFYGLERLEFTGAGGNDVARFYDSAGDDSFVAEPFSALWSGDGFSHSVNGVSRMHVFGGVGGVDSATLTGSAGRDSYIARQGESKFYNDDFYIRVVDVQNVYASANDAEDRAYLHGDQTVDDVLTASSGRATLSGEAYLVAADGFSYVLASAGVGGNDTASVEGTEADEQFRSEHTTSIWDEALGRLILKGFESVDVAGGGGNDTASLTGSHLDEHFAADGETTSLTSSAMAVSTTGFSRVDVFSEGGQDSAAVRGGEGSDVFRGWSDRWSLIGSGITLVGHGFEYVAAEATDSSDIAYLYDSAQDDWLEMWSDRAVLRGDGFENAAAGFGRVVAEGHSGGTDRATYHDDASRSTVRYNGDRLTVFGRGFSNNAKGFEVIESLYETLDGNDRVELSGDLQVQLIVDDLAELYRLTLASGSDGQDDTLQDRVSAIPLT